MAKYTIGLDYGSLSVRALLLDADSGEEKYVSVFEYPHKVMEDRLPTGESLAKGSALQHPQDYLDGLIYTVTDVMKKAEISPKKIAGIGIDSTGSTLLPVSADAVPLCFTEKFAREPHAYMKMWKHHSCEEEAVLIDKIAKARGERWLSRYGGKISSEWVFPKVLETIKYAPEVYDEADRFIDAADWIVWQLTGKESRSACVMGYKAFYDSENGFPEKDFFRAIHPKLDNFVEEKINSPIKPLGTPAGYLTEKMSALLGLPAGIPVATAILDAHAAVLGAGINNPGELMIVMGTSSCYLLLSEAFTEVHGIGGIVKDGILPGYYGYEAGQSCVGDGFAWFIKNCVPDSCFSEAEKRGLSIYQYLSELSAGYRAGESGLLALDWLNGVRTPLMDFDLSGMILGLNLSTKPEEIYRALIEATGYGARMIVEQFESTGIPIHSVVLSGGIPKKNPMLVQIYADILNREIRIAESEQVCAHGAAILGAAAALENSGALQIVKQAKKPSGKVYVPQKANVEIYSELYCEYKKLHSYFAEGSNDVMKHLSRLRKGREQLGT